MEKKVGVMCSFVKQSVPSRFRAWRAVCFASHAQTLGTHGRVRTPLLS